MRSTQDGVSVCTFTVAVNRRKKGEADYFDVTAWRERGEICAKYLDKGSKVSVVGSVSIRTWDNGEKHGANLCVTAEDVEFLSKASNVDAETGMQVVDPDGLPY